MTPRPAPTLSAPQVTRPAPSSAPRGRELLDELERRERAAREEVRDAR